MKHGLAIFAGSYGFFYLADLRLGYAAAYHIGYGALTIMALAITLTFLWLFVKKATPLALGMVFSWGGAASVMGWWWVFHLLGRPEWMARNAILFVFLSLYLTGAILHFRVIQGAVGLGRQMFWVPVLASAGIAAALHLVRLPPL